MCRHSLLDTLLLQLPRNLKSYWQRCNILFRAKKLLNSTLTLSLCPLPTHPAKNKTNITIYYTHSHSEVHHHQASPKDDSFLVLQDPESFWETKIMPILLMRLKAIIIDYGPTFVTLRKEIELKGVQFPGWDAPDKISVAANRQSPLIPRKFVVLYHRTTKIRMHSDKCD